MHIWQIRRRERADLTTATTRTKTTTRRAAAVAFRVRVSDFLDFIHFQFFIFRAGDISTYTRKIRFLCSGAPPTRKNSNFCRPFGVCGYSYRTRKPYSNHTEKSFFTSEPPTPIMILLLFLFFPFPSYLY